MADDDNPFANSGDEDRTIIRPSPGRRPAAAPGTPSPPSAPAPSSSPLPRRDVGPIALPLEGPNPIIAAASLLLAVATRLARATQPEDVATLRQRVIEELKRFEGSLRALALPPINMRAAHYAICATIDDIVLNTPWGSQSVWTAQSLVSTFHHEVTGGERFFEILAALQANPGANIDVLEFMFTCLSLGFAGKYRVSTRGTNELAQIREGLYRLIRQVRGDFERELSPNWQGVPAPHRSLASYLPTWVVGLVAAVALLVVYMGLSFTLSDASDPAFAALAQLPPREGVMIASATPPAVVARPSTFLAREVAEGIATVAETDQSITVTLKTTGLFASGSATVQPAYVDILTRIADQIETQPGRVKILGHTDNVPIRTLRFPSNFALSLARAQASADLISARLSDHGRVSADGRADTEPVASNDTPAGREANRRIEIVIVKPVKA